MQDVDRYMLGVLIFMVTFFVGNRMSGNAMRQLSEEKKNLLFDMFTSNRWIQYVFIMGTLAGYYVLVRFTNLGGFVTLSAYFVLLACYIVTTNILAYRKLRRNDFPPEYIQAYLSGATIRFAGLAAFFVLILM